MKGQMLFCSSTHSNGNFTFGNRSSETFKSVRTPSCAGLNLHTFHPPTASCCRRDVTVCQWRPLMTREGKDLLPGVQINVWSGLELKRTTVDNINRLKYAGAPARWRLREVVKEAWEGGRKGTDAPTRHSGMCVWRNTSGGMELIGAREIKSLEFCSLHILV